MLPEFIMLIGLPGCGKSTEINRIREANPDKVYFVTSSDDLVMEYAVKNGMSYREAHDLLPPDTLRDMLIKLTRDLLARNVSIINDQTNLTDEIRKSKLAMVPSYYVKKAIVIKRPLDVILAQQQAPERVAQDKLIPKYVMDKMVEEFTDPDPKDFDEITFVQ